MTFKYKVKTTDTWSSIAKQNNLSAQQVIRANPGASSLSTGMGIQIPQYQVTSRDSVLNGSYLPAHQYNAAIKAPPPLSEWSNPAPRDTRGTGNFNMNYNAPSTTAVNTTGTGNIYNDPYASIKYERDPLTHTPVFHPVPLLENGQPVYQKNFQGKIILDDYGKPVQATTPASIYVRDVPQAAAIAGVSTTAYIANMQSNGYTLFGGAWVYVGTGGSSVNQNQDAKPARLANGNLAKRRNRNNTPEAHAAERAADQAAQVVPNTQASNFGVGTG